MQGESLLNCVCVADSFRRLRAEQLLLQLDLFLSREDREPFLQEHADSPIFA